MRWVPIAVVAAASLLVACSAGGASPNPSPSISTQPLPGGGGGGGAPAPGGSAAPPSSEPSEPATPSPTGDTSTDGPFKIDQTIGDAHITALVCRLEEPFSISVTTSKVAFEMGITPHDQTGGDLAYAYSLPALGETDTATGSYTVGAPTDTGDRRMALKISDHTVFKGVDTTIPIVETLQLVPVQDGSCP